MHNNFYFLRQLKTALEPLLSGFTVVSCFSQNKDELIIELNNAKRSYFIKASLVQDFQCLSFPENFHRARKNSIDLFPEIILQHVRSIRQFSDERSLALIIGDRFALVFKMHGRQANVVLFDGNEVHSIFRNNLSGDQKLKLDELDRSMDWSYETFVAQQDNLEKTYFTLGKPVWEYLESSRFHQKSIDDKWAMLQVTRKLLESPKFFLTPDPSPKRRGEVELKFTLLPNDSVIKTFSDPVEAINEFFIVHQTRSGIDKERANLLSTVRGRIDQTQTFLAKSRHRLEQVESDSHFQHWADLIMANLHQIAPGSASATLEDYQNPGNSVVVKLKKELSPQKNAALYYRKTKNRTIELEKLREKITQKEHELAALNLQEKQILEATDSVTLRQFSKTLLKKSLEKEKKQSVPYHEHLYAGFLIWVGKNSKANDELTLHFAHKDDLWLHAKDVAGSHVVIKFQSGKPFPKNVIEHAAALAAFHSKRKTESLCPVVMTYAKHVRKRKGDPAGMVVVEREKVIMVEPRGAGGR